ncbi:MAG: hypothetical protein FWF27_05060 [Candidatus Bathyarchaeota archaeon]|nr:hypothetical protein [Candidatus Termiticorpusculum sp.]
MVVSGDLGLQGVCTRNFEAIIAYLKVVYADGKDNKMLQGYLNDVQNLIELAEELQGITICDGGYEN